MANGARPKGVRHNLRGAFHFSRQPNASWHSHAKEIVNHSPRTVAVQEIAFESIPSPAARERTARLDCRAKTRDLALSRPDGRADLTDVLTDLEEHQP